MSWLKVSKAIRAGAIASTMAVATFFAPVAAAEKYASIVVDANSTEILHARHADDPRYPASLTKVMTLYMLFDAIDAGELTLDDKLTVSSSAARQPPSNLRLKSGSKITVAQAIEALVNKSANDVAVVVAERLGGSESRFAHLMTEKAKLLGMQNTTFRNASGLPDTEQVSTARDLALLSQALLNNHADYYYHFADQDFYWNKKRYSNHNDLLGKVRGVDGIKTGYTRASGFNLIASAERDGRRVIAVMLGGTTAKSRNQHVEDLLEAAFQAIGVTGAPGLRSDLAFAQIKVPLNPNAAAEPMLNGVPLSQILGQGSAGPVVDDISTEEGDGEGEGEEDPLAALASFAAPTPGALTVAEYEAQQTGY